MEMETHYKYYITIRFHFKRLLPAPRRSVGSGRNIKSGNMLQNARNKGPKIASNLIDLSYHYNGFMIYSL